MDIINGSINANSSVNKCKIDLKDIDNINKKLKEKHQKEEINSYGTTFRLRGHKKDKNLKKVILNNDNDDKIINKPKNIYDLTKLHIFNYGIKLIDFGCSKMFTRSKRNFSDIYRYFIILLTGSISKWL